MVDQAQKTPVARALESFAQRKAGAAIQLLGKSLPASVVTVVSSGIVTVKFELTNVAFTLPNVTVPIFGSEYVRLPIQVGMKGAVIAFDAYLGGVSGLGGGTADLTPRPSLSNLCFAPLGSKSWSAVEDPNALVLYGPDGVIIRDAQSRIKMKLQATVAEIDLPAGVPLVINGAVQINGSLGLSGLITAPDGSKYTGDIHTSGTVTGDTDVVAGGISGKTHKHPGVQTGSGQTGQPI